MPLAASYHGKTMGCRGKGGLFTGKFLGLRVVAFSKAVNVVGGLHVNFFGPVTFSIMIFFSRQHSEMVANVWHPHPLGIYLETVWYLADVLHKRF